MRKDLTELLQLMTSKTPLGCLAPGAHCSAMRSLVACIQPGWYCTSLVIDISAQLTQ